MKQRSIFSRYRLTGRHNIGVGANQPLARSLSIVVIATLLFYGMALAQTNPASIKATLNRSQVLIGEPIDLLIEVKSGLTSSPSQWFNLPDTFNHLEVLRRFAVDTLKGASGTSYQQHITLTGFEPGVWVIPPVHVVVNKSSLQTDPIAVTIVPAPLTDSAYHGIREIIDVPESKPNRAYRIAGILSAIALAVLLWLWLKSRVARPAIAGSHVGLSPLQEACNSLKQLSGEKLVEKKEWKKHYSMLTGILKRYVERKFRIPAMQYTTDELLLQVQARLGKDAVADVAETLRVADAVKFARYQPTAGQAEDSAGRIETTLQKLDKLKL